MDKRIEALLLLLVVVGAVNWGLVGLFEFDLVAAIVGEDFGTVNIVSRIIYTLVGVAGLGLALGKLRGAQTEGQYSAARA
jgi:uncharacterized membrane protein YuzA (DUF378 family)